MYQPNLTIILYINNSLLYIIILHSTYLIYESCLFNNALEVKVQSKLYIIARVLHCSIYNCAAKVCRLL